MTMMIATKSDNCKKSPKTVISSRENVLDPISELKRKTELKMSVFRDDYDSNRLKKHIQWKMKIAEFEKASF